MWLAVVAVVLLATSLLTSPVAVVQLLVIILKIPYYAARVLVGYFLPSLLSKDVSDDNVLITGGGGGLGTLMAIKFAKLGAKSVALLDINQEALEKTKARVEEAARDAGTSTKVHVLAADLSQESTTKKAMEDIQDLVGGPITILINNAGIVTGKKVVESPVKLMKLTMAVNIEAHFWTVKAVLPSMMAANRGHIVTIASSAGIIGVPGLGDYCASKHAAVGFDESIRLELQNLGCSGVQTTCVCPFFIKTGMFEGAKSRWPRLLPLLEPDYAASKIVRAIRCNQEILLMPLAVHLTPIVRLLPVPIFDQVCKWIGVHDTMAEFKGWAGKSSKQD